jgi:hypothetical protein
MGFSNCKDVALTIEKIMKTLLVFKMSLFCNSLLPKNRLQSCLNTIKMS